MKKNLIALAITGTFALAGCSSVPKPVVPDGSERTPINSPAKIEDFKARTAEETANYNERTALARQVEALNRQVAELKAYLLMAQMTAEANRQARAVLPAATPAKVSPAPTPAPAKGIGDGGETIEVRERAVVFRVTHPFGKADFMPSSALEEQLLSAARAAKHIEIRGRTDAQYDNPADRAIALQRALRARGFLISNGIAPSKIRWMSMASGGHVADNSTIEGRAKNRRVEIETMDLDTTAFNELAPTMSQGQMQLGSAK